jgi:acetylornithine deacetylase
LGVVEEIRSIVGELEQEMKQESAATSAEVELIAIVPGLDAARDGDAARFLAELGIVTSPTKVSYGTEAGIFELSDVSSVICGPGHMTQAHKPDEFIEVEQLIACEQFMSRLAETLHGEGSLIR